MYVKTRSLSACSFQYPLVIKEAVVFQDAERIWAHAAKFNCPPVLSQEKYRGIRYGHVHRGFSHMIGLDFSEDSYKSITIKKKIKTRTLLCITHEICVTIRVRI